MASLRLSTYSFVNLRSRSKSGPCNFSLLDFLTQTWTRRYLGTRHYNPTGHPPTHNFSHIIYTSSVRIRPPWPSLAFSDLPWPSRMTPGWLQDDFRLTQGWVHDDCRHVKWRRLDRDKTLNFLGLNLSEIKHQRNMNIYKIFKSGTERQTDILDCWLKLLHS